MIDRKLFFSGETIDLSSPDSVVKSDMQAALDVIYEGIIVVNQVMAPNNLTFETIILRGLPASKCDAIGGGWLSHFDESMITGLSHEAFKPDLMDPSHRPLIYPTIPYAEAWWAPDTEFAKVYIWLNEAMCSERIKSVKITKSTTHLNMRVVFKK